MGKRILLGKSPLSTYSESTAASQRIALSNLVDRLPQSLKGRVDVDGLAGRLDSTQFDAVKHYIQQRYLQ